MNKIFFLLLTISFFQITLEAQEYKKLILQADNLYNLGKLDSALILSEQATASAKKQYGANDTSYIFCYDAQASYLKELGKYDKAIAIYKECISIIENKYGTKNKNFTNEVHNLAETYRIKGNYNLADSLYNVCYNLHKKYCPNEQGDLFRIAGDWGMVYKLMGKYDKAEMLYQEALDGKKKIYGEESFEYAGTLNNCAALYREIGNLTKAEEYYLKAIDITVKTKGKHCVAYATFTNNLASFYYKKYDYKKAEKFYQEALQLRKELLGTRHPDYASTLNNLANVYYMMHQYDKVEPLYIESMKIRKETLGEQNIEFIKSVSNMAAFYGRMGNKEKSIENYNIAIKLMNENYGERNPLLAHLYNGIGSAYFAKKDYDKAQEFFRKDLQIRIFQLNTMFSFLSEKEKEKFWKTFKADFDEFNTIAYLNYKANMAIASEVYDHILLTKGLLFNSSTKLRSEILFGSNDTLIKKYKEWMKLREQLGSLYQQSNSKNDSKNGTIDSLEKTSNNLEKELSKNSNTFSEKQKEKNITWKDVQKNLKPNEAAIEIHSFFLDAEILSDSIVYIALIIKKEYEYPKLVYLCGERALKAAIQYAPEVINDSYVYINSYVADSTASHHLYKLIWQPIDSLLQGTDKVFLSLSGLTHKISFNAIKDPKELLLLKKYNIAYINSTRSLALLNHQTETEPKSTTAAVFGGIRYDVAISEIIQNSQKYQPEKKIDIRGISEDSLTENKWNYLPGTYAEATTINTLFQAKGLNTKLFTGSSSLEEVIKNYKGNDSPNILHIATHGYFYKDPGYSESDPIPMKGKNIFENSPNPLYRSGLLMAGANRVWCGGKPIEHIDDGILTAYEVANLDLRGTQLAVLSACETGLGDIKSGEGVYGLQRSFQLAGVKSIIMSLWQIPDKESMELMEQFYTNYLATGDRYNSLRNAQLQMSQKYPPYFWSAFVLVE